MKFELLLALQCRSSVPASKRFLDAKCHINLPSISYNISTAIYSDLKLNWQSKNIDWQIPSGHDAKTSQGSPSGNEIKFKPKRQTKRKMDNWEQLKIKNAWSNFNQILWDICHLFSVLANGAFFEYWYLKTRFRFWEQIFNSSKCVLVAKSSTNKNDGAVEYSWWKKVLWGWNSNKVFKILYNFRASKQIPRRIVISCCAHLSRDLTMNFFCLVSSNGDFW